jgi:hypothetical protein
MEEQVITIFCIIDDILKTLKIKDDPQTKMSSSEVLTTAIVACLFFGGNFRKSLSFMFLYCSYVLDESRFHRRLKRLNEKLERVFEMLVAILHFIPLGFVEEYAIDFFPIRVCENIRANRCKLASSQEFRGYVASKRTYFHGIKLHIVASNKGYIREFLITPGSVHDVQGLYELPLNLEKGSVLYADRGYTDYEAEDLLKKCDGITLMPIRRKNSKRFNALKQFIAQVERKFVETVGSCLNALFSKKIHAVTLEGFIMKVKLFVLSYNVYRLTQVAS